MATNNSHHVFHLHGLLAIASSGFAVGSATAAVALVKVEHESQDGRGSDMGVTGDGNDDVDE